MHISKAKGCPGFYIIDTMADFNPNGRVVNETPFASREAAERERQSINIAGDCIVARLTSAGDWRVEDEEGFE